ncbi:MAG: gliding motility-associated C-terminal domain-containing protein, partial [Ginsengibacter sp.]
MKYIIFLICGFFLINPIFSQGNVCRDVDTTGIYKFLKSDTKTFFETSKNDNNQDFLALYHKRLRPDQPSFGLVKIDKNFQPKFDNFFSPILSYPNINFYSFYVDSKNSILIFGGNDSNHDLGALAKISEQGEMKWLHLYKNPLNQWDFFDFQQVIEGRNSDIITMTQSSLRNEQIKLCMLDSNGLPRWSRTYGSPELIFTTSFLVFNGTEIALFGQYLFGSNIDRKSGMFLTRINYKTGEIITTKSFWLQTPYKIGLGFAPNEFKHFNYDSVSKKYMMDFYPSDRFNINLAALVFDSGLNFLKGKQFILDVYNPLGHTRISPDNYLSSIYSLGKKNGILSTVINGNLEIVSQKKISIQNYLDNGYNWQGAFSYKQNGYYDLFLTKGNQNDFFLLRSVSFLNSLVTCPIVDTTYLTTKELYVDTLNFQLTSKINSDIIVIKLPVIPSENKVITKEPICQQISICDSISIRPISQYCFSDSQATISLFKNSSCLRNIQWQYDSSAFQRMNDFSDTSLKLKFLKPFNGFIYAALLGCNIRDSIKINVIEAKKNVEINKDSILCPGKKIILRVTPGFMSYRWQDGNIQPEREAVFPGLYKVVAVDSCGNNFSDSVLIKKGDTSFIESNTAIICPEDTISVAIPAGIKNLQWLPHEGASFNNNFIQFFPSKTTQYSLIAQTATACEVQATYNIALKNCPEYIYFPNAFTPNMDGVNDEYRAVSSGKLIHFDLKIFNRWGQLIFQTNNIGKGWKGTFKGAEAGSGTYIYVSNYQF